MYLFIFDDGDFRVSSEVAEVDFDELDNGLYDLSQIIDISNPSSLKYYRAGSWDKVDIV